MKKQDKKVKSMGQVSDEDLVVAARNGDSQAMEALLLRYTSMVRSIARGYFLAGGDMEDLIQEGMIALYGAVKDYVFGSMRFKSFAYLCVTRRILDAVKASGRLKNKPLNNYVSLFDVDVDLPVADPLEEMIDRENGEEFFRKINEALSDFEFRVLMLYMKGYSVAEMCEITKKNEKSIDNALQRSKKKIENLLGKTK
ncbi:MAG: sigma-70 family RNA polymerase sigma factor [Clostridia bacterium]|nr:sigma-70 family RNA polymerase sigma factor [Clostridia bacterium]